MRTICILSLLGVVACGGKVGSPAGSVPQPDGGGAETGPNLNVPFESGAPPNDGGVSETGTPHAVEASTDAGVEDDGWSGTGATEASAPPPTCAAAALACGAAFPGATSFASAQDAANALVERWSLCYAGFIGEEYAADGTYYELQMGIGGQIQRNLDPTAISNWEVKLGLNGDVEIHTYGGTHRAGLSACPTSLVFLDLASPTTGQVWNVPPEARIP